jgi:hypothetical protein
MANHYHLLVETPEIGLSSGMQWLNQRYAQEFNKRHGRVGHLFQGRFKGILVERESHLLELLRYIVLNPVRCGTVVHAGDYEWSNYRTTAGLAPAPDWLEVDWTLRQFGGDRVAAQEGYRQFVAARRGASYDPWEALTGQLYLGSDEFCERMDALARRPLSREHPKRRTRPAIDSILSVVSREFGVGVEGLRKKSRGPSRKALAHVAIEEGLTLQSVAECIGVTPWAVSKLCAAGKRLAKKDPAYRAKVEVLRRRVK